MTDISAQGLSAAERAELEALRAEIAELRRRTDGLPGSGRPSGRGSRLWRWVACGLLFTLAGLLAIGGVAARYARSQLLDTDRYVQTVTPIAADPAVQSQVASTATAAIIEALNVEQVTSEALSALADAAPNLPPRIAATLPSLAPAIAGGVETLVNRQVTAVVTSPAFADFWVVANRAAHQNLVTVLTGEGATAVQTTERGDVTVSLAPIIDQVKAALVDRGLTIAGSLPRIDATFTVFQSDEIVKLQRLVALLDSTANAIPFVTIGVGALGVLAAPRGRRRKAIATFGVVIAMSMAVLGLGLNVGRSMYLNAIPASVVTPAAAVGVFDPLVEPMRWMLRAVLVFGLAVAVVGYLTGSSPSAMALRRWTGSASGRVRGRRAPSAVERWIGRYRRPLQLAATAVGVLILVMWQYPTGTTVAWIAVLTGLVVLAIAVVGAPARPDPVVETPEAAAAEAAVPHSGTPAGG